jgi:hypothetical protein
MDELMTFTKFGKRWDVSRQYIGRMARQGRLPTKGGKIVVQEADRIAISFGTSSEAGPKNA